MDKIEKALKKLTEKERDVVRDLLRCLAGNETENLDIKKLKGHDDIFRVRKASLRIIYRKDPHGRIFLLAIERRSESTYKL